MSLHGEVKVNGEIIGHWQARRTTVMRDQTLNVYECKVSRIDIDGTYRDCEFRIGHHYGDGALYLAQKVIQVGNDYLNGKKA